MCLLANLGATGIHKQGLMRRFTVREDKSSGFDKPKPEYNLSKFVPLECPAGTLVLLHVRAYANMHTHSCNRLICSSITSDSLLEHFVLLIALLLFS